MHFSKPRRTTSKHYFILICQSAHQLLITIRSRSQRVRFVPLTSKLEKNIVRQNIRSCIEQELDESTTKKSNKKSNKKSTKKSISKDKDIQIDLEDPNNIEYCVEKILRLSDGCPQRAYAMTENRLEEFLLFEQLKSGILKSLTGTQIQKHQFTKDNAQHISAILDIFDLFSRGYSFSFH